MCAHKDAGPRFGGLPGPNLHRGARKRRECERHMRMFAFSVRKSASSPPRLGIGAEPGKHVGRERGEGGGVEEAWVMRADAPVASRRALAERSNRPPEHNERRRNGGVGKEAVQRKVA